MTFLPIVMRELLCLARRRATYWTRVFAGTVALLVFSGLILIGAPLPSAQQGRMLFKTLSVLAFFWSLLAGIRMTADCLSVEKREGTLGLLFLTDLKGYDVILGKLVSSSVTSFFGLLGVVPVMSLGLLMGGLTMGELFRVVVLLLNTLLLSLAVGIFVSTISKNERKAMFATACLVIGIAFGPLLLVAMLENVSNAARLFAYVGVASPWFAFEISQQANPARGARAGLWISIASTHLLAWIFIGLASRIVPRVSQDRPTDARGVRRLERWRQWLYGDDSTRRAFRKSALDCNPFMWLASRERQKSNYVWFFLSVLGIIWLIGALAFPDAAIAVPAAIILLFTAHGFFKVWLTSEVCHRFIEDRRSGALELLLSTPLSVPNIAEGQWLALRRQFSKPVAALLALDLILFFFCASPAFVHDEKAGITMAVLAGMIMLVADLKTLRWVAMWLSLQANTLNQVFYRTLVRVLAPPWFVCLAIAFGAGWWSYVFGRPAAQGLLVPLVLLWFGISGFLDSILGLSAKAQFLGEFRTIAAQRFESKGDGGGAEPVRASLADRVRAIRFSKKDRVEAASARSRRFAWRWAIPLTVLVALAGAIWYRSSLHSRVERQLSALRKGGHPVTLSDLDAFRPIVGANENAATIIREALVKLSRPVSTNLPGIGHSPFPVRTNALRAEAKVAIRRLSEQNAEAFEILATAARLKKSRYSSDPSQSAWFFPQFFDQVRQAGHALFLDAVWQSEEGNTGPAERSIHSILGLARSLTDDPNVMAHRVRFGCLEMAARSAERLLTQHQLTDAELRALGDMFSEFGNDTKLMAALEGQRCLTIYALQKPAQALQRWNPGLAMAQPARYGFGMGFVRAIGQVDRTILFYLDLMKEYEVGLQLPFPNCLERVRRASMRLYRDKPNLPPGLDVAANFLPSIEWFLMEEAEVVAQIRVARTACAVERFRLKHGTLPAQISDLVPEFLEELPADPFDGKAVRYRRLERGYCLYSVGSDTQDQGGLEVKAYERGVGWFSLPNKPHDVTFIVER